MHFRREIGRLDQLVTSFLRFSRSEHRERQPVDMADLLQETARLIQKEAEWREIEVELEDRDFAATMLPGTSVDVEIILEARADVLRIPSYSLIEGNRVFVVNDGTIVAQKVAPGIKNWDFTEVTSGLEVDELVVVSVDRVEVTEGAKVRITGETLK